MPADLRTLSAGEAPAHPFDDELDTSPRTAARRSFGSFRPRRRCRPSTEVVQSKNCPRVAWRLPGMNHNCVTDEAATTLGLVPRQASETALPLLPVARGFSVGAPGRVRRR
jgi:hypothetical protein